MKKVNAEDILYRICLQMPVVPEEGWAIVRKVKELTIFKDADGKLYRSLSVRGC